MLDTANVANSVHYERIVVPIDRNKPAEVALVHARTLAQTLGIPIHLLSVVDITTLAQAAFVATGTDDLALQAALTLVEAEEQATIAHLEEVGRTLGQQGLTVAFEVRRGVTLDSLLEAVHPSDLLVMEMHNKGGILRWLLGDDADAVIRRSPAPVLLVR
jgi:nucleotide-binding universal stress UspA family protein